MIKEEKKYFETIIEFDKYKRGFCIIDKLYYIPAKYLNRALHGDRILVKILNNFAIVQSVIERNKSTMIGTVRINNNIVFIKPWNDKFQKDFYVNKQYVNNAKNGDVVEFVINKWDKYFKSPSAKIEKIITVTSEQELFLKLNLPTKFPESVLQEIQELKEIDFKDESRIDLRHLEIFSIDPKGSKDLDDALSIEVTDRGYRVGVHIADVTAFIKPGTELDQEAFKRGCTVYLPNTNVPMIPHTLSENLCSLLPNEDRYAVSLMMNFDKDCNLVDYYIFRSIIHNRYQFTYEEAEYNRLNNEKYHNELNLLYDIGLKVRNTLLFNEIDINKSEINFEFNELNEPIKVKIKKRIPTNDLIQSWMLVANLLVTKKIESINKTTPWIYRVHPFLTEEQISEIKKDLKQLDLIWNDDISTHINIKELLLKNSIVSDVLIKYFKSAYYSHLKTGHFAIGTDDYTHFTSPIRRYSDVIIHRILLNSLDNKPIYSSSLERESAHLSTCEKNAEYISKMMHQTNCLAFIKDIKYSFQGVITGFSKRGVFIRTEFIIDGIMPSKFCKGEWDVEHRRWDNYKIGDIINVKVSKIDLKQNELILKID